MSKKPDLSGLINRAAIESKPAPTIESVISAKKKPGPAPVWENAEKLGITLPADLALRLRDCVAAARLRREKITMNEIIAAGLEKILPLFEDKYLDNRING